MQQKNKNEQTRTDKKKHILTKEQARRLTDSQDEKATLHEGRQQERNIHQSQLKTNVAQTRKVSGKHTDRHTGTKY